jgi:hypothetical protein
VHLLVYAWNICQCVGYLMKYKEIQFLALQYSILVDLYQTLRRY